MSKSARIFHTELWGTRGEKYQHLGSLDVANTNWAELKPKGGFYLFVPQDQTYAREYRSALPLREIFRFDSVGVVTARDRLTIHIDEKAVLQTVRDFVSLPTEAAREKYALGADARDWKVTFAQQDLRTEPIAEERIRKILYRPFDVRFTYYTGRSRGFIGQPQQRMANQMHPRENLGLCTARSLDIRSGWEHVFCANTMIQHHAVSLKEVNYIFPLYVYPAGDSNDLFSHADKREVNLLPEFITAVATSIRMQFVPEHNGHAKDDDTFGPKDVFHYLYAIFHSPAYRQRYAEFLKMDFPRLPLTTDAELFRELCAIGAELTKLHLMEEHAPLLTRYPIAGDNTVDKPRYTAPEEGASAGRVWINPTQYFGNVPPEVWEFRVGGYQVAEKWLKDRKGRPLTYDDLTHYQRTLSALQRTIELMNAVDASIERHGGWPLAGSV